MTLTKRLMPLEEMQKIVIDTNVLVSALIQKGYPYHILTSAFNDSQIQICISKDLFGEYFDVFNRPRFSKYPDFLANASALLSHIESIAVFYNPEVKLNIIKDADDNKLLELAETAKAQYLITGNTNDFIMKSYKDTQIVTPKEYWEEYSK